MQGVYPDWVEGKLHETHGVTLNKLLEHLDPSAQEWLLPEISEMKTISKIIFF